MQGHRAPVRCVAASEDGQHALSGSEDGGLFLWVRAPAHVDTTKLLERALEHHVAFVPGAPFWVNSDVRNTLRVSFSNSPEERIVEGIKRLAAAVNAARNVHFVGIDREPPL